MECGCPLEYRRVSNSERFAGRAIPIDRIGRGFRSQHRYTGGGPCGTSLSGFAQPETEVATDYADYTDEPAECVPRQRSLQSIRVIRVIRGHLWFPCPQ